MLAEPCCFLENNEFSNPIDLLAGPLVGKEGSGPSLGLETGSPCTGKVPSANFSV